MSRVHDALRRAEQGGTPAGEQPEPASPAPALEYMPVHAGAGPGVRLKIHPGMLQEVVVVPYQPAPESHLLDLNNSHETPAEEFRTLRTRLNHLRSEEHTSELQSL